MPTEAILGATGGLGSAVLRTLLSSENPDLTINILVRNKAKLLKAFPQLEDISATRIKIFEGSITNEAALTECVRGASTIYACVATNNTYHKVDVAFSTAASLVSVLNQLRRTEGKAYQAPVILFNRSLSMSKDVKLPVPRWVKDFFYFVIELIYDDLERALVLYQVAEKDELLSIVVMDAPMLADTEGTEATGYEIIQTGTSSWYLSYPDFGNAAVDIAQRRGEFEGKTVAISATGKVNVSYFFSLWIILTGLRHRLIPF